jgi:hypothetical protein
LTRTRKTEPLILLVGWLFVLLVAAVYDVAVGRYVGAGFLLALGVATVVLDRRQRAAAADAGPGAPAGWYADPDAPDRIRYWDGTGWTEHRWRADTTPVWFVWTLRAALLLLLLATWTVGGRLGDVLLVAFAVVFTGERLWRRRRSSKGPAATSRSSS